MSFFDFITQDKNSVQDPERQVQSRNPFLLDVAAQLPSATERVGKSVGGFFSNTLFGGVKKLGRTVNYPLQTGDVPVISNVLSKVGLPGLRQLNEQGKIDDDQYRRLLNEFGNEAGFSIDDTRAEVARKVGADVTASVVDTVSAVGIVRSAPSLAQQAGIQGAGKIGALYGSGSSVLTSLREDDPTLTGVLGDAATGAAIGGALGYGIGKIAPRVYTSLKKPGQVDDTKELALKVATNGVNEDAAAAAATIPTATRPTHQKLLEQAHNAGDDLKVKQILDSIPDDDPYKPAMMDVFGDVYKSTKNGRPVADIAPKIAKEEVSKFGDIQRASAKGDVTDLTKVSKSVDPTSSRFDDGAGHVFDRLIKRNKELAEDLGYEFKVPKEIGQAAKRITPDLNPEGRFEALRHLRGAGNEMTDLMGSFGSDVHYKLVQGAKREGDLKVLARDDFNKLSSIQKKIAKTDFGRGDASEKIFNALRDRKNKDQILVGADQKQTDNLREAYDIMVKWFDFSKGQLKNKGATVKEDYAPEQLRREIMTQGADLYRHATASFNRDVTAASSKKRWGALKEEDISKDSFGLFFQYMNAQFRQMAYTDAFDYVAKEAPNVSPLYLTNQARQSAAENYMAELLVDVISPKPTSKLERSLNRALGRTYRSTLGFGLRYSMTNVGQRILSKSQATRAGKSAANKINSEMQDELLKHATSGTDAALKGFGDLSDELAGKYKPDGKLKKVLEKFDYSQASESGNLKSSFLDGVGEAVTKSDLYKQLREAGIDNTTAIHRALQDPEIFDQAVRQGNRLTARTQIGGNLADKPSTFREKGFYFGVLPKTWVRQYKRFPIAMTENLLDSFSPNEARARDILLNGNPQEVGVAEYYRSVKAMQRVTDRIKEGVKRGEVSNLSEKQVNLFQDQLDKQVSGLEKEMKKLSTFRAGKNVKAFAKMWGYAAAIQFMFEGGLAPDLDAEERGKVARKSLLYGVPVIAPGQAAIETVVSPVAPILPKPQQLTNPITSGEDGPRLNSGYARAIRNQIPGVGLVSNRINEIIKLYRNIAGVEE